jgi:hypothetical protein
MWWVIPPSGRARGGKALQIAITSRAIKQNKDIHVFLVLKSHSILRGFRKYSVQITYALKLSSSTSGVKPVSPFRLTSY